MSSMHDKTRVIEAAFAAILGGDEEDAAKIVREGYPFKKPQASGRDVKPDRATRVFFRDGFIDRYSGERLLFPPVLRVLSHVLPEEFPFHPNWKMTECHQAYWELWATVDHGLDYRTHRPAPTGVRPVRTG